MSCQRVVVVVVVVRYGWVLGVRLEGNGEGRREVKEGVSGLVWGCREE